jgi:DNA-binding transcriptional regulator YiaG
VHNLTLNGDMVKSGLTASQIRKAKRTPGLLYTLVRSKLGLTQVDMAALLGVSRWAIVNRERCKRVYTTHELVALQRASGLSDTEWCELLREIAK